MKVLFASSEAVPYCKTGGLADVAGALPAALAKNNITVLQVLPMYRAIRRDQHRLQKTNTMLSIPVGRELDEGFVWAAPAQKNLKTVFIDSYRYFDRDGLYGHPPGTDFYDNDRRFIFFSRAVLEVAKSLRFKPDIVHLHDWQTGLTAAYLKSVYRADPFFKTTASVFTIHNMAYQGNFPAVSFGNTNLPTVEFSPNGMEFYNQVSFLKGGLAYADALTTVSPTYAKEIVSDPSRGAGMDGLLAHRRDRLKGILNGLDMDIWNPKTDRFLESSFDSLTLQKREKCKADLQVQAKLPVELETPVLGFVGRLDRQKGVEILLTILPSLLRRGVQMIILGVGDPDFQNALLLLQSRHPKQLAVVTTFAEPFAHKIYAGCDLFLMPSLFEPCGLGQMIAMRYGALPVATPTGGLLDTIRPLPSAKGTGFMAADVTASAFEQEVLKALAFISDERAWLAAQKRAMKTNFSWSASVPEYKRLYQKAQSWQRGVSKKK